MLDEIRVGAISASVGAVNPARSDKTGAIVAVDAHGRYQEAVLQGGVYIGANLGGTPVTTQAGLSATTPALTLYNPIGSGVNLVLLTATVNFTAAPAAACAVWLASNAATAVAPATTTAATLQNANLGTTAVGKGQCYRVATLAAAPLMIRNICGTSGAGAIGNTQAVDRIDGEIVAPPGVAVSIQTSSAAILVASFTWEEVLI